MVLPDLYGVNLQNSQSFSPSQGGLIDINRGGEGKGVGSGSGEESRNE